MTDESLLCPSVQPDEPEARVFGIQTRRPDGTVQVGYLTETVPLTPALIAMTGSAGPAAVLRIAGPCITTTCANFQDGQCGLGGRIASMLDPVVGTLPRCAIRPSCRWFRERGPTACLRCPQVVTNSPESHGPSAEVAYLNGIGPRL